MDPEKVLRLLNDLDTKSLTQLQGATMIIKSFAKKASEKQNKVAKNEKQGEMKDAPKAEEKPNPEEKPTVEDKPKVEEKPNVEEKAKEEPKATDSVTPTKPDNEETSKEETETLEIENLEELLKLLPQVTYDKSLLLDMQKPFEAGRYPFPAISDMLFMYERIYTEWLHSCTVLDTIITSCIHFHNVDNPHKTVAPHHKDMLQQETHLSIKGGAEKIALKENSVTRLVYRGDTPLIDTSTAMVYCNFLGMNWREDYTDESLFAHCIAQMVGLHQLQAERLEEPIPVYGCYCSSEAKMTFFRLDEHLNLEMSETLKAERDLHKIVAFMRGIFAAMPYGRKSLEQRTEDLPIKEEMGKQANEKPEIKVIEEPLVADDGVIALDD